MKQIIASAALAASCVGSAAALEAKGSFEITLKPVKAEQRADDSRGRMLFEKRFSGGLSGESDGEMLTAGSPAKGKAGYVALERFHGTLDGREGSFVMQHSGIMDTGREQLDIHIVPDSGTGQLAGIRGTATIDRTGGKHFYTLSYTLP
jgi:hypothetical protein